MADAMQEIMCKEGDVVCRQGDAGAHLSLSLQIAYYRIEFLYN